MPNKIKIPATNELFKEFLTIDREFGITIDKKLKAESDLEDANNLGLKNTADQIKTEIIFIRNKMFLLHLRLNRVFNLLLQKQRNFAEN